MTGAAPDAAPARPDRYARRAGVIETDLGAELILLDPATGEMFSLNDVGRLIWRALDDAPLEAIVARVVEAFEVSPEVAEADARALVRQLLEAGLIVAAA